MQALRKHRLEHIRVVVGGIVPNADEQELTTAGVARVFHPGANLEEIAREIAVMAGQARDESVN